MAQSRTKKLGFGEAGKVGATPLKDGAKLSPGKAGGLGKGVLELKPGEPLEQAIAELASSIRALQADDGSESVEARVEIGHQLQQVQEQLPHGAWLSFLSEEVDYAYRTARRLIQLGEWATQNKQLLERVRRWGPTKVYEVMDAGPVLSKRLLSRKHYFVEDGKKKTLDRLTHTELKVVLNTMSGSGSGSGFEAGADEEDGGAEALRKLKRDSKRVIRWVNQLVGLDEEPPHEELAKVHRRLVSSAKKLEKKMVGEA